MRFNGLKKILAIVTAMCMLVGAFASAEGGAETPAMAASEFEALYPVMDLVAAACMYSVNAPDTVPGEDGVLSVPFIDAFMKAGLKQSAAVGVTEAMLEDTDAQAALLGSIFASQLPALEKVVLADDINSFIGFHPVTVNSAADGNGVRIVGEIYMAARPLNELSESDYADIQWLERGMFTFRSDASAMNGFRVAGFTVGTELAMEQELQTYFEEIVVEYVSTLGFTLLYPSVFTDDMLVEDATGVSAALDDGSVSFFAKRVENMNGAGLEDYISVIADGIAGAVSRIDEEAHCGSVKYTTDDGYAVFDVYIVTDKYIYQAELRTLKSLMSEYAMYLTYLENSFVADEVSFG